MKFDAEKTMLEFDVFDVSLTEVEAWLGNPEERNLIERVLSLFKSEDVQPVRQPSLVTRPERCREMDFKPPSWFSGLDLF